MPKHVFRNPDGAATLKPDFNNSNHLARILATREEQVKLRDANRTGAGKQMLVWKPKGLSSLLHGCAE